jgi:hypothetical protein
MYKLLLDYDRNKIEEAISIEEESPKKPSKKPSIVFE